MEKSQRKRCRKATHHARLAALIANRVARQLITAGKAPVIKPEIRSYINTAAKAVFFCFRAVNFCEGKVEGVVHTVTIEDCKKISATAIDSVDAFSSAQIVLSYSGGRITVAGSGLKIVAFSKQSGAFCASGTVTGIKYLGKAVKLTQKLFK